MKKFRFLGIDDSFKEYRAYIAGAVVEGNSYLEGVLVDSIDVDGLDATDKIIRMVKRSKFREQIHCIFLSGITFGGFNVADIEEISERLQTPVVVVTRKKPDFKAIMDALRNVSHSELRKRIIEKAGDVHQHREIFFQFKGCSYDSAVEFITSSTLKGNIPECLRIAHMIASAIVHGESRGRV